MRFNRFPRVVPYVVTTRKLAYARRAIQTARDRSPLFPELTDQRDVEQRMEDNARHNTPDAFSVTHGERRYHYMAPCRIESVSGNGLTIIAVIEYQRPCPCADLYNGERLRLDLTEVWPPVWLLSAERHERQTKANATAAVVRTPEAAPSAPHPWDTGGRGLVGSPKAGSAVLRCPHCQVTFYESPTCPSCGKAPSLNPEAP